MSAAIIRGVRGCGFLNGSSCHRRDGSLRSSTNARVYSDVISDEAVSRDMRGYRPSIILVGNAKSVIRMKVGMCGVKSKQTRWKHRPPCRDRLRYSASFPLRPTYLQYQPSMIN